MTERELQADLRALIRRWEAEAATCAHPMQSETIEDCIADLKELLP